MFGVVKQVVIDRLVFLLCLYQLQQPYARGDCRLIHPRCIEWIRQREVLVHIGGVELEVKLINARRARNGFVDR